MDGISEGEGFHAETRRREVNYEIRELHKRGRGDTGGDSNREGPGPGRITNYRTDAFIGW